MRESNVLLDWDEYKRNDELYEYTSVGGASRRKKKSKEEFDIIDLPTPIMETISYNKEAKSYRKVPRSVKAE